MPNYIKNRLRVEGSSEEVQKLMDHISSEGKRIDFNKIIRRPEHLQGVDVTSWAACYWGVKKNCVNCRDGRTSESLIFFETEWSGVPYLMESLGREFPMLILKYSWVDNDRIGFDTAKVLIQNGRIFEFKTPKDGSAEAFDIVFEIFPDIKKEYVKIYDGGYEKWGTLGATPVFASGPPQKYRHFKGNIYTCICQGLREADGTQEVVYQSEDGQIWIRPSEEFFGLTGDGKQRFETM